MQYDEWFNTGKSRLAVSVNTVHYVESVESKRERCVCGCNGKSYKMIIVTFVVVGFISISLFEIPTKESQPFCSVTGLDVCNIYVMTMPPVHYM